MIECISEKIAVRLHRIADSPPSVQVMTFALVHIVNVAMTFVLSAVIGWMTGAFWETLFVFYAFLLFRSVTGGIHAANMDRCLAVSTLIITTIPHIPVPDSGMPYMNLMSIALCLLFAPSRLPEGFNKTLYPYLKMAALLMIATNWLIPSILLSKVLLAQSLTLIRKRR